MGSSIVVLCSADEPLQVNSVTSWWPYFKKSKKWYLCGASCSRKLLASFVMHLWLFALSGDVHSIIDVLNERCQCSFTCPTSYTKQLTIDESLILWWGRLLFRQTIRLKRARVGVKMYPLCTSNGITLGFTIHSAKKFLNTSKSPIFPVVSY